MANDVSLFRVKYRYDGAPDGAHFDVHGNNADLIAAISAALAAPTALIDMQIINTSHRTPINAD